jgi:hypothetical protein
MSVSTYIDALAPFLASDSRKSTFITIATNRTSREEFGVNYELAVALRACHMMAKNPTTQPGNTGAETSRTEGEISQSFQVSQDHLKRFGDLATTSYGEQLCQLIDGCIVGHIVPGYPTTSALVNNQGNSL